MNESFPKSMICGRSSYLPTQPDRLFNLVFSSPETQIHSFEEVSDPFQFFTLLAGCLLVLSFS
ncbi:hypothetical protein Hdeb2414_s0012g00388091 [Helianthus debilis subsp. tardiflorus]